MKFKLTSPCKDCPFLKGNAMVLNAARAAEIRVSLVRKTFPCHKTLDYDTDDGEPAYTERTDHCAGALILQEKTGTRGDMQQVAQRLGLYHPENLNMEAPVYDDWEQMEKDGL